VKEKPATQICAHSGTNKFTCSPKQLHISPAYKLVN